MGSWINLSRDITRHWIWKDAERLKWWLDLLLMASWADCNQLVGRRLVEVKRGQVIASAVALAKRWGRSRPTVIKFLKLLSRDGMITRVTLYGSISLLTVCNYDKYQRGVDGSFYRSVDRSKAPATDSKPDNYRQDNSEGVDRQFYRVVDRSKTPATNSKSNDYDSGFYRCVDRSYNNNNNKINKYDDDNVRAREEGWLEIFTSSSSALEGLAMQLDNPAEVLKEMARQTLNEWELEKKTHDNYTDFARHLITRLRAKVKDKRKEIQSNGNKRTTEQRAQGALSVIDEFLRRD